jgi:RimJ/RimL family protein N-acetyltransferase
MITLRKFSRGDFPILKGWITSQRFCIQWSGPHFSYPLDDDQLEKYLALVENDANPDIGFMAISDGKITPVGHIKIGNVDIKAGTGTLQCIIIGDEGSRNKGMGRELVARAAAYAFNVLGLGSINLKVFDFNISARSCYKKIGFEETSRLESSHTIDGITEIWGGIEMNLTLEKWIQQQSCRKK